MLIFFNVYCNFIRMYILKKVFISFDDVYISSTVIKYWWCFFCVFLNISPQGSALVKQNSFLNINLNGELLWSPVGWEKTGWCVHLQKLITRRYGIYREGTVFFTFKDKPWSEINGGAQLLKQGSGMNVEGFTIIFLSGNTNILPKTNYLI